MNINWKVRVKNKAFWLALIPALLLLAQVVAAPFGYEWDFAGLNEQLTAIINAAFAVLAILGIVADPTTAGVKDSYLSQSYEKPANHARELADAAATEPEQVVGDEDQR